MKEARGLNTGCPGLSLRLQAPSLTVGSAHARAVTEPERDGTLGWRANAGAVTLRCELRRAGEAEWRMRMSLENGGDQGVEARVAWPYLFYHFADRSPVRVFDPKYGGVLETRQAPIGIDYPGPASFCLTAAAGAEHTLAVGLLNAEQRHVSISHVPAGPDGQIRFLAPRVLVAPGTRVELPEQFIRIGSDWGEAFAPYRDFARAAFPRRRERPRWLVEGNFTETRKAHCLAPWHPPEAVGGVWIFDDRGRPRTIEQVKREIDEAFADGAANGYTPLFYQFGWWQTMADLRGLFMFDSVCGDYDRPHALTRAAIDYIHSLGGRTYLYTNAISAGDETAVFARQPELFVRDAGGAHVRNADYPMYLFCPGAPGIRDYWERVLRTILVDLDADGLFLDQIAGGTPPSYCYAPEHGHAHPDTYGADIVALIDWIAERARQLKPDAFVAGELVLDARSPLLDETHGCGYNRPTSTPDADDAKPAEYYAFVSNLCPQISSSVHARENLMNGGAGSHAWPEWQCYRTVFESGLVPCKTSPSGAVAYLFGPKDGMAILAVRATVENLPVRVTLPQGFQCDANLPGVVDMVVGLRPIVLPLPGAVFDK